MKLLHVNEIRSAHKTDVGDMIILADGTICEAVLYDKGQEWVGYHIRRTHESSDCYSMPKINSQLQKKNRSGDNWIVLVTLDKPVASSLTFNELEEGMVFRFKNNVDKRVFFFKRKSILQPKMIAGEIPIPCNKGIDTSKIELLWVPKMVTCSTTIDGVTLQYCINTYDRFLQSRDDGNRYEDDKLKHVLTPGQVEAVRKVRSLQLLALREEVMEKDRMQVVLEQDID